MKKKTKKDPLVEGMNKIQAQLAVLDNKLDQFMTKSLAELAQALAAARPVPRPPAPPPQPRQRLPERPGRMMYAVICFDCGNDCEIPFKPSGDRPVYCKGCFAKRRGRIPNLSRAKPPVPSTSGTISPASVKAAVSKTPAKARKKSVSKKKALKKKTVAKKKTAAKKKTTTKKALKKKWRKGSTPFIARKRARKGS